MGTKNPKPTQRFGVPKPIGTPKPTPTPKPPVFGYPVEGATVSQGFGNTPSNKNIKYQSGTNLGTDFAASMGSEIKAPLGGKVIGVNKNAGAWGNQVVVQYPGGATLSFNHLSNFGKVKRGQIVPQGYVLGQVGATGQTTGAHLDLEATLNGVSVPLASAFKGYQFDSAYKGGEYGVKNARGYNRSENKFYDLDNLGVYTPDSDAKTPVTPSPKPGAEPKPTPSPSAQAAPAAPSASADGVVGGNVNLQSIRNPSVSKQFSGVTQGNIPLVG